MLHDLLVAVVRKDGGLHLLGRVGGSFSMRYSSFLSELENSPPPTTTPSPVPTTSPTRWSAPGGSSRILLPRPRMAQTGRGGAIDKMVLHWDADAKRYAPLRRLPLTAPIANFVAAVSTNG